MNESPIVTKNEASLSNVLGAWPQQRQARMAQDLVDEHIAIQTPHTSIDRKPMGSTRS